VGMVSPRRLGACDRLCLEGFSRKLSFVFFFKTCLWIPLGLPIFICIIRLGFSPLTIGIVGSLISGCLGVLLREALRTKWLAWQHIPVLAPARRFFRRYGRSENSTGGRYRSIGNVGYCLGFLSGYVFPAALGYLSSRIPLLDLPAKAPA